MTALLAGALSALLVCGPCIAYRLGERTGYRKAQWDRDCDWITERIRQACGYYDMFPEDWDARADELFRQWDAAEPDRCDTECVWTYRRLMERTRPVWRRDG